MGASDARIMKAIQKKEKRERERKCVCSDGAVGFYDRHAVGTIQRVKQFIITYFRLDSWFKSLIVSVRCFELTLMRRHDCFFLFFFCIFFAINLRAGE